MIIISMNIISITNDNVDITIWLQIKAHVCLWILITYALFYDCVFWYYSFYK